MIELKDTYRHIFSYTQAEVEQFAAITGDDNPLHLDPVYAAQTMFKKPIIHGFFSGAVFSKILGTEFPGKGTIYMNQTLKFLRPMYVETTYAAVFTVTEIHKETHKATIQTEIVDTSTNKVVLTGEAKVMNPDSI